MCEHLKIPGHEGAVIICGGRSRKQYCHCGRPADFLCDWKIRTGFADVDQNGARRCGRPADFLCDWKIRTGFADVDQNGARRCSRPLCRTHAAEAAPGKHLCAEHDKSWQAWKRAKYAQGIDPMPHGAPEQQSLFPGPL